MKKGISLVALVITTIVLIILTSAVILILVNTSILDKVNEAKNKQNEQEVYSLVQREILNLQSEDFTLKVGQGFEDALSNKLKNKYPEANTQVALDGEKVTIKYTLNNETYKLLLDKEYKLTLTENVDTISTKDNYIGYYADVDGDKEPDGIIYADLAFDGEGELSTNGYGKFSYKGKTGLKDYYVSKINYKGDFGTKDVLTATGNGLDRFYVMDLKDINIGVKYRWYVTAYGKINDSSTVTSTDFGTGKTNTKTMIEKWNNKAYGTQNENDIWGVIQDKVGNINNPTWFIPSSGEWSAFACNLGIKSNYKNYNLPDYCWSSSVSNASYAWLLNFLYGSVMGNSLNDSAYVRLSATF